MVPSNEDDETPDIFSRVRDHQARDVIAARRKFQWRYATLNNDFRDLMQLKELSVMPQNDVGERSRNHGYVFEVERRLHHYLSGLYTFLEVHQTIQDGIGNQYRDEISDLEDRFRGKESSRTLLGLRHYIQHENVLPLKPYTSSIDRESQLVVLLNEIEIPGGYQDGFQAHYGHLDSAYCIPLDQIEENWPHVQDLFRDTTEVLTDEFEPEIEEYTNLVEDIESLTEEVHQELLSDSPFSDDFLPDYS